MDLLARHVQMARDLSQRVALGSEFSHGVRSDLRQHRHGLAMLLDQPACSRNSVESVELTQGFDGLRRKRWHGSIVAGTRDVSRGPVTHGRTRPRDVAPRPPIRQPVGIRKRV
jgi:hypothetical protein